MTFNHSKRRVINERTNGCDAVFEDDGQIISAKLVKIEGTDDVPKYS